MAKRTVKIDAEENLTPLEPEPTEEEKAAWEAEEKAKHEAKLAPYRAFYRQQSEQDELIAEMMFKETMREIEEGM